MEYALVSVGDFARMLLLEAACKKAEEA